MILLIGNSQTATRIGPAVKSVFFNAFNRTFSASKIGAKVCNCHIFQGNVFPVIGTIEYI